MGLLEFFEKCQSESGEPRFLQVRRWIRELEKISQIVDKEIRKDAQEALAQEIGRATSKLDRWVTEKFGGLQKQAEDLVGEVESSLLTKREKESMMAELDKLVDAFHSLEKFVNTNFLCVSELVNILDDQSECEARIHTVLAGFREHFWVSSHCERLLPLLKRLKAVVSEGEGDDSFASPHISVNLAKSRKSFLIPKHCIRSVQGRIQAHLPQRKQDATVVDAMQGESQICSVVYLDNVQLESYHSRVYDSPFTSSIRLRWFATPVPELVYVERAIYSSSTGSVVKESFSLRESFVLPFLRGHYTIKDRLEEMRAAGHSAEEQSRVTKLFVEVQSQIESKRLRPVLRTIYRRVNFDTSAVPSVRMSLDSFVTMVLESPSLGDDSQICDDWFTPLGEGLDLTNVDLDFGVLNIDNIFHVDQQPPLFPLWMYQLTESGLLEYVPEFSKFLHGCASLRRQEIQLQPWWTDRQSLPGRQSFGSSHVKPLHDLSLNLHASFSPRRFMPPLPTTVKYSSATSKGPLRVSKAVWPSTDSESSILVDSEGYSSTARKTSRMAKTLPRTLILHAFTKVVSPQQSHRSWYYNPFNSTPIPSATKQQDQQSTNEPDHSANVRDESNLSEECGGKVAKSSSATSVEATSTRERQERSSLNSNSLRQITSKIGTQLRNSRKSLNRNGAMDPEDELEEEEEEQEEQQKKPGLGAWISQLLGKTAERKEVKKRRKRKHWDWHSISLNRFATLIEDVLTKQEANDIRLCVAVQDIRDTSGNVILHSGQTAKLVSSKTLKGKGNVVVAVGIEQSQSEVDPSSLRPKLRKEWTVEDLCIHVVRAKCSERKKCFVDLVREESPALVGKEHQGTYVIVSRATNLVSLCDSLITHHEEAREEAFVWLDLFGINQAWLDALEQGKAPVQTYRNLIATEMKCAMEKFNKVLLCLELSSRSPLIHPLDRRWCLWEVFCAPKDSLELCFLGEAATESNLSSTLTRVKSAIHSLDVEGSFSARQQDRDFLLAEMRSPSYGGTDQVKQKVQASLEFWLGKFVPTKLGELEACLDDPQNAAEACELLIFASNNLCQAGNVKIALDVVEKVLVYLNKQLEKYDTLSSHREILSIYVAALNQKGAILSRIGDFEASYSCHQEALSFLEREEGTRLSDDFAITLKQLGVALHGQGKWEEAKVTQERAILLLKENLGQRHDRMAQSLNQLGEVLASLGRWEEAIDNFNKALRLFERVLDIYEAKYGGWDLRLANVLVSIASTKHNTGDLKGALISLEAAYEIKVQALSENHSDVADLRCQIARVEFSLGKFDDALRSYMDALKVFKEVLGPSHVRVAQTYDNIGVVLSALSRLDDALAWFESAKKIFEHRRDMYNPIMGDLLLHLGSVLANQDKLELAQNYLDQALEIFIRSCGEDSVRVADTLEKIALVLERKGDLCQASELLRDSVSIRTKALGQSHPLTAAALRALNQVDQAISRSHDWSDDSDSSSDEGDEVFSTESPHHEEAFRNQQPVEKLPLELAGSPPVPPPLSSFPILPKLPALVNLFSSADDDSMSQTSGISSIEKSGGDPGSTPTSIGSISSRSSMKSSRISFGNPSDLESALEESLAREAVDERRSIKRSSFPNFRRRSSKISFGFPGELELPLSTKDERRRSVTASQRESEKSSKRRSSKFPVSFLKETPQVQEQQSDEQENVGLQSNETEEEKRVSAKRASHRRSSRLTSSGSGLPRTPSSPLSPKGHNSPWGVDDAWL